MAHGQELPEDGVPRSLHSVYTGKPFDKCVECDADLLQGLVPYAVEKVRRQGEVVLEYAVCASCMASMFREYSEESVENIKAYLEREGDFLTRGGPEDSCHRCGATGEPFQDEHTITAMLIGEQVLVGVSTLCGRCQEGMEQVLSQKTRDVHGDFVSRNLPGVPGTLEIPIGVFGA